MSLFWGALNNALQFRTREPESRVSDRVNKAFAKWTHHAQSEPADVRPLRVIRPEVVVEEGVVEQEEPAVTPTQPAGALIETPAPASERADSPVHNRQHPISDPQWTSERLGKDSGTERTDYYEILQLSRTAEVETIHRVYRMMAARFHPDNALTGNLQKFLLLREAYQVLSKPDLRADYDQSTGSPDREPLPVFGRNVLGGGHRTEVDRRLCVLSLLYNRRRASEERPSASMLDLEHLMSIPREYLQFTLWYLKSKGYVTVEENSEYCITSAGADYLEEKSGRNRLIRELLTGQMSPVISSNGDSAPDGANEVSRPLSRVKRIREGRAARRRRRAIPRRADPAA